MTGVKTVFGAASFQKDYGYDDHSKLEEVYKLLEQAGCDTIDTATIYGQSEQYIGETSAGKRFKIDTKAPGGIVPGSATKDGLLKTSEQSKKLLGIEQVDIWYIHAPAHKGYKEGDSGIPMEETLAGVNEVYKTGFFKRFGLSNFLVDDVQKVYDICKREGYVLPRVYQGNYNSVARKQEEVLFPTLRKLGIAFYAYSPIAGGFLVKDKSVFAESKGRWDSSTMIGQIYHGLYNKPSYLEALEKWNAIAKEEGVTKAELAYRWTKYHSALDEAKGDALIIGASRNEQLKQTLESLTKGPLSEKAVKAIQDVWEGVKHDAGLDNINR